MKKILMRLVGLAVLLLLAAPAWGKVEVTGQGFWVDGAYYFPVGVNYMPVHAGVRIWKDYDGEAVRREFKALHALGLNTVRTFIYWEDLNPKPGEISKENLAQVRDLMDAARENGLMVIPTLNTGHMSGGNWYPSWMRVGPGEKDAVTKKERFRPPTYHFFRVFRDIYEDRMALAGAVLMARAVAGELKDHPALLYYDLGNEPQYWERPRTAELGRDYVRAQVAAIREVDPNHPVSLGMGKFAEDTGFKSYGPEGIAGVEDLYLVHTYPANYYPLGAGVVDRYVSYYAGFENRLSLAAGLPVQFQEFGLSDLYLDHLGKKRKNEILAGYYRVSTWSSQLAGANAGILSWMSNDYVRRLALIDPYSTRPYELDFGIMDQRYKVKPSGEELSRFAKAIREIYAKAPTPTRSSVGIVLPEEYQEFRSGPDREDGQFTATLKNHNRFLFSAYLVLRQLGVMPSFDLPESDLANKSILIVPMISAPSDEFTAKLKGLADEGTVIYLAGPGAPAELRELSDVVVEEDLLEIGNALKPNLDQLTKLRERYEGLFEQAGVGRWLHVDEPFVEAGIIDGTAWHLVLINHLEQAVTTEVDLGSDTSFGRCYYGAGPAGQKVSQFEITLPGFGVEVCELAR